MLFEEFDAPPQRYYVLTLTRPRDSGAAWRLPARSGLIAPTCVFPGWKSMAPPAGLTPISPIRIGSRTGQRQHLAQAATAKAAPAGMVFPRDDPDHAPAAGLPAGRLHHQADAEHRQYRRDRFTLAQPSGTELVNLRDRRTEPTAAIILIGNPMIGTLMTGKLMVGKR